MGVSFSGRATKPDLIKASKNTEDSVVEANGYKP